MKLKSTFLIGVALCGILASCSSPESDGKKAAEKFCDCDKEFTENLGKETQNFISNFADFGFQTRVEAREKSEELIEKASRQYESCVQKAQQEYSKFKEKYVGNYEKVTKFEKYSCKYYHRDNKFPKIQFVIIDDEEVIFISSLYKNGQLCAVKDKVIVDLFVKYFDASWKNAILIKEEYETAKPEVITEIEKRYTA